MALAQRNDIDAVDHSAPARVAADHRYEAGGHVAWLQAELARQLTGPDGAHPAGASAPALPVSPADRAIRLLSTAGGYAALLAGYAAVAMAIVRWA